MKIRSRLTHLLLLGCLAQTGAAGAVEDAMPSGTGGVDEVQKCVEDNLPDDSSVQTVIMTSTDRVGAETRLEAKIYWQKDKKGLSKALLRFSDPPDMRDSALLILEKEGANDMFMYLPALKRVRRVTTRMMSGSMFGTDYSYEDFERLQGMAEDLSSERLADAEVAGRKTWVIVSAPKADHGSDYEKILTYIDTEMCVPLQFEFFEKGNKLRKRAEVDFSKIVNEGGSWVPTSITMVDMREDTKTSLLVEGLELHAKIPRKTFSQSALEKRN
jgi:hypothetical protein